MFKKLFITVIILSFCNNIYADEIDGISGKSAILIEQNSGKVIFENNADERLAPASVTKVMTIALIYDAVRDGKIKWEDDVTISEYAASMGGSQIFLEPMEVQKVQDLTKAIIIASANDGAVAMAEKIGGSEEGFVKMMNEKAKELGMKNTTFVNACGLDTEGHLTTARDIALMSRYLLMNYPEVTKYTTIWQDTITHKTKRGEEEFGLTNTNKLVKWYDKATGLKTGSTGNALFCLSASAQNDDLKLISVIMASPDSKTRFRDAIKMFDYAFANYTVTCGDKKESELGEITVLKGKNEKVPVINKDEISVLVKKGEDAQLEKKVQIDENIRAPFEKGVKVGEVVYYYKGEECGKSDLVTKDKEEKATFYDTTKKILNKFF